MLEPIIENSKVTIKNLLGLRRLELSVDDDEYLLKVIKSYLEMQGRFEVKTANSAKEGEKRIRNAPSMLSCQITRCQKKMVCNF